MKALLWCTALLGSLAAFGQVPNTLTCTAAAPSSPTIRQEGFTEGTGDILLTCSGGSATPANAAVPTSNVTVTLNTGITSRLLSNGTSDALLIIDDPGGSAHPTTPQLGCNTLFAGGATPAPGQCNYIQGTGTGSGTYNGTPSHPNIYQGAQSGPNSVTFYGVPIDPPGTGELRMIRATNIRANANQVSYGGAPTVPITGAISFSNPLVTVANPPVTVAVAQPGVAVGTPVTGSFNWCPSQNGGQIVTQNPNGTASAATFSMSIQEGFAQAFKPVGPGSSIPGVASITESGFTPNPTAGLAAAIGTADTGTTFQIVFMNIPAGLSLTVPVNGNLVDTKGITAGTYITSSPTGTTSGSNGLISSPDSTGTISFYYQIVTRDPTNPLLASLIVPFTVGAAPTALQTPLNFMASSGFHNSPFSLSTLFALGSSLLNNIPGFNTLDSGVSNPGLVPYLFPASVIGGCTANSGGGTLNTTGAAAPTFIGVAGTGSGTTLIAPRLSNYGIVSVSGATSNVSVAPNPPAPWLNVSLSGTTTPLTASLNVNNAPVGSYSTSLNFSAPGGVNLSVPITYTVAAGPWFTRYGFAHSASYVGNVVAPGEPFVIFGGDGFGPAALAGPTLGANGLVVTALGNTQVLFDGTPAPLYYSVNANGAGQVAGFAPFELAGKTQTNVQVVYNGVTSPPVTLNVLDAVPGLYTASSSGGGQGAILNHDLTVNSAGNPESPGNVIVLYGGGAGQTSPAGRDGGLAGVGAPLATLTLPVKVFIDNIAATNITYAGPAPGIVEGVFQINVVLPAGVRHNANVPVVVQVEDKQTQPGVTLATK
jgi:uncharacterized protein (TIGR03437 family)